MGEMFSGAAAFNGDVSSWDVCKEPGVCTLLALRDISHGHTVRHNDDDYEDDGVTTPLSELDGWKDLTVDTRLEGPHHGWKNGWPWLEGITIDGSGLVTQICIRKRGLSGEFKNS